MAQYRCCSCGEEGEFTYHGNHACPVCGSRNVQLALAIDELANDDPLIAALIKLAEDGTD
jgi:hypothetical protein